MSVCFLKLLPNGEYSNRLIAAAFLPVLFQLNLYLPTFPDDRAELLAVCSIMLLIVLIFTLTVIPL